MTSTPPTRQQIEDWCNRSGALRALASRSFIPGEGIDMRAIVYGYTLENGTHQFNVLQGPELDPTTNKFVAAQLNELTTHGAVNLVEFHVKQPLPVITAAEAASPEMNQSRINDRRNWAIQP